MICPASVRYYKTGIRGADPPAGFDLPEVGSEGRRSGNSPHKNRRGTVFRTPEVLGSVPLVPRALRPGVRLHRRSLVPAILVPRNCRAGSCQKPAFRLSRAPRGKPWPATTVIMRYKTPNMGRQVPCSCTNGSRTMPHPAGSGRCTSNSLPEPLRSGLKQGETCGCVQRPGVPWQCVWW